MANEDIDAPETGSKNEFQQAARDIHYFGSMFKRCSNLEALLKEAGGFETILKTGAANVAEMEARQKELADGIATMEARVAELEAEDKRIDAKIKDKNDRYNEIDQKLRRTRESMKNLLGAE